VLTPEELTRARGYGGGWGGRSLPAGQDLDAIELVLDLVILEDGLCVGPDESGVYEALNESLDQQRATARECIEALRAGASVGQVFEIVRPLARERHKSPDAKPLLSMFGGEAVQQLIHANTAELTAFFEKAAAPRSLELHRPMT
jgi:hypothetical protein